MAIFNAARILSILAVVSGAVQHAHARAVETLPENMSLSHGATTMYGDQVYKLHQVGDGLFAGVKEEDWDDKIHVRNAEALPYVEARSVALPEGHLFARDDVNPQCQSMLSCASPLWDAAKKTTMFTMAMTLVDQLVDKDSAVMSFLNQPFYANLLGVGGQNFYITAFYTIIEHATGGGNSAHEDCSNSQSQEELLRALIALGCQNNPERSAFSYEAIYPDGSKWELRMAATPGTSLNDSNVCDAPR